jgi:hypothetical protein
MAQDQYEQDREALRLYAGDVRSQAPAWDASGRRLNEASVHDLTFTGDGHHFFTEYQELVAEHAWYAWRIGVVLGKVGDALETTARNYGRAEAVIEDDITRLGEAF